MQTDAQETGTIHCFHAHVYYDPLSTRAEAAIVREQVVARFPVQAGRWHDVEVGPHTQPMYQLVFSPETFATLVPWLMLNRRGLDVLIHPDTGWPRRDHLVHGFFLGNVLPIKGERLPERSDPA
jgi:aromatic ring-cleaving dioxygenase